MSIFGPHGRHRAPNKLSTAFSSTARVSATIAIAGGVAAAVAAPQAAHAATGLASVTESSTADFTAHAARSHAQAHPLTVTQAQPQLQSVQARGKLADVVHADAYVVPDPVRTAPAPSHHSAATPPARSRTASAPVRPPRSAQPTTTPTRTAPATTTSAPATGGVIAIGKSFLGTPYVYGGASPSGFDCSGLTQYVFGEAGKQIPRTATAQMNAAQLVTDPQPGDLVFFGSRSYAYHVGIYLGGGKMISAPKPGDVVKIQSVYTNPVAYGRL